MMLRLTVRDARTGVSRDVEVTGAPASSVGWLLAGLPVPVDGRRCFVGNAVLEPHATLATSPLISGSVISVGGPGPVARPVTDGAAGVLEVIRGPDAGLAVALSAGTHVLGRNSTAAVPLRDPDVSRRGHARLRISHDGTATAEDLGSSNGTFVGNARVDSAALPPGKVLRVGRDELVWTPTPAGALRATRAADGRLDFDRAFAPVPAVPRIEMNLPFQQQTVASSGERGLLALAPIAGSVVYGMSSGHMGFIIPGALVSLITYGFITSNEEKRKQEQEKTSAAGKKSVDSKIAKQVTEEQRIRRLLAPDPAEIVDIATGARADLWTRRAASPNGLALRVGVADQPASVTLRGEPWPGFKPPTLSNVPVTVDLAATGVLGVVGADEPVDDMVRWLLSQLATLRGPDDLRIVLINAGRGDRLAWASWLPHVSGAAGTPVACWIGNTTPTRYARVQELRTLVADRRARREAAQQVGFGEDVVVVLDGALALRELPGMDEVLRDGPSVGVYLICADEHGMNECRGLCEVTPGSVRLTRTPGEAPVEAKPDYLGAAEAERLGRALAPMRDRATLATTQNAIPGRVRLLDLLGMDVPAADDVLAIWGTGQGPRTRVVLGADASGPVHVDLADQGPHTMLGGATGAGKSILLQTLVSSLLLANRPDELNLVLVDFKGGSAFLPFEGCPHVVALIRSTGETAADVFDDAAAARVLASIRAEVSRRESILARYHGEIDRYWRERRTNSGLAPLPRLVMIFDEFGRVLDASPDFVKELVNVAAKGRSLGMHLVLATQSLQGKLSPELKNNISLRISLRQNEAADSSEVLGVPDAATIPGALRGRGMIFCTTAETRIPRAFQSGYLGDPPPSGPTPVTVRTLEWTDLGEFRPDAPDRGAGGPTDQALVIAAVEEAARRARLAAPFQPLLPPLPATLTLDDLAERQTAATPPTAVPYGLADEPAAQAQPADFLDLGGADRLLVAGGPQSGRTTVARTLITSLVRRFRPDQAHFYVFERQPAGLSGYAALPHCGGVFSPAEPDRIRRLITWLAVETDRRNNARLAESGEMWPQILVVIDGWEYFENYSDPKFQETSLPVTLREIVAAGAPVGVHVVPIGGQDMLNHKMPSLYTKRLLLPFPKEDTRRAHLNAGMSSPPALPGRAIDAGAGRHVQVCQPTLSVAELTDSARRSAADADPTRTPRQFPALPTRISLDELPIPHPTPSTSWLPLGTGGLDGGTVGIDLFETGTHLLLVSGPAGSGRTSAGAMLAHALRRLGIGVLAVASPRSALPRLLPQDAGTRVVTGVTVKDSELREAAAAFGGDRYAAIIDDVEHLTVLPNEQGFSSSPTLLDDIAHPAARGRRALIVTADAAPVLTGFPSPLARLLNTIMATGSRLVLTPENRAAALAHNLPLEPDQYLSRPPGRGYLVTNRTPTLLQLATQPGG